MNLFIFNTSNAHNSGNKFYTLRKKKTTNDDKIQWCGTKILVPCCGWIATVSKMRTHFSSLWAFHDIHTHTLFYRFDCWTRSLTKRHAKGLTVDVEIYLCVHILYMTFKFYATTFLLPIIIFPLILLWLCHFSSNQTKMLYSLESTDEKTIAH